MFKALLLLLVASFSFLEANNQKVSLQLKWKYQFQFAGFIIAKEKGFYRDLGLDVELKELSGGNTNIVNEVLNQKSTFGVSDSALIYDKMHGKNIKALLPIFQESPFILLGLKRDDIKTINDINGKTIAMHEGVDGISLKAMLKAKNISYKADSPVFDFNKLLNKEIDLKSAYLSNEVFIAKKLGIDIITFFPRDYGFLGYGDILFTSNETINKNPKMVQKFYQASKKGWEYAFENIAEVVEMIYYNYNSLNKSKEALYYEAKVLKELSGFGKNFGEFNIEKIKGIAQQFNLINEEYNTLQNISSFIYQPLKEKLKVCFSKDMQPYNFLQQGKEAGYGIDIIKLIEKNSDFSFEFIAAGANREDFALLRNKKCDIVPTMVTNVNVTESIRTTIPYGVEHVGIATLMQTPFIEGLGSYKGTFGFNKKYTNTKAYLQKLYPGIKLVMIDQKDLYKKLATKEIDAYLDGYMFLVNTINQKYYGTLKLNNMIHSQGFNLGMGVHKDNKELLSKLNKLIENLDQSETEGILKKWRHFEIKKETDYSLAIKVILISLILLTIVLFIYIRDQKQKNKIKQLNKTLEARVKIEVEKNRKKEKLMLHQSRLAQMGEMISMIAHQWRQPLNNLSVLNQTIVLKFRMDKLDSKIIEGFKHDSKKQIQQMSQTIDDFSNFFKPDKEKSIFSLNESITDTISILKPIFDKNEIQVDFKSIEDVFLDSYKNELSQALLNILSNAKDALIENNILDKRITIVLEKEEQCVLLKIIDNAGGIDPEIISKIFDPYFSTKNEKNGTGLGLYMTKIILEDHMGGDLQALNNEDGAVFIIKLLVH